MRAGVKAAAIACVASAVPTVCEIYSFFFQDFFLVFYAFMVVSFFAAEFSFNWKDFARVQANKIVNFLRFDQQ